MSLTERVQVVERLANPSNGAASSGPTVELLREEVGRWISFDTLAAVMTKNPQRAKNELRTACKHVFAEWEWADLSSQRKREMTEELVDVVFGLGPIEGFLADESITEIMVNSTKSIFIEKNGCLLETGVSFDSDDQVRILIDRIIGPLGRRIDESSPMVNARLPQGHRVHAVIPPISPDGPHLTIRAFTKKVLPLEDMMKSGSFGGEVREFIEEAVRSRKNIVVSGGTGSGKTTLLNAMSKLIPPGERVITIEDSAELKFNECNHVVRLEARPMNAEGTGEITIRELVINALRMRPDRIIVGECRSGEAIDMLQAMNTGHDGSLTTLHSNSPEDVVDRMVTMVRYAVDLPVDAIEAQIGNAFDLIIHVCRDSAGKRFITSIAEVGFDRIKRCCRISRIYVRDRFDSDGIWMKSQPAESAESHTQPGEVS